MILREVLDGLKYENHINENILNEINIKDIAYNSRECRENYIFVAIVGETVDGHKYVKDAISRGARVIVINKDIELEDENIVKVIVEDSRIALSKISANFYGHPSREVKVIGITGTKGKTTTSNYIKQVLDNAGYDTGVIGTNGVIYKDVKEVTYNTTPESYETHRILRNMVDAGVKYVAMEVSSGGLMMNRVNDVDFDLGIFTNISHDHIGPKEHPNFEHYLKCKSKLFTLCKHGIVNLDADYADYIIDNSKCSIETFSIDKSSDYQAIDIELSERIDYLGVDFKLELDNKIKSFSVGSPGIFSVYNALTVIATCRHYGIDEGIITDSLKKVKVSGRVERLPLEDKNIILDYAHNETSLENVLDTLRQYKPKRLICLIGSVGGRSIERRYEIGKVISEKADVCVLTSDNPDFEDPDEIIEDIYSGFIDKDKLVIKEADRKKAVEKAIDILEDGDILLLAGKGHETHQLIEGERLEYSDKNIVMNYVSL